MKPRDGASCAIACNACTLGDLFLLGVFEPASVQREYQWTTKEAGQLLSDLLEVFMRAGLDPPAAEPTPEEVSSSGDSSPEDGQNDEPLVTATGTTTMLKLPARQAVPSRIRTPPRDYFIGPMVLLPALRSPGKYFVYDGLQRFTTLTILFAVLRDTFEGQDADYWLGLRSLLVTDKGDARLKSPTPGGSLVAISAGASRGPWRGGSVSEADVRMRDASRLFHERMSGWSDKRRTAFAMFLKDHAYVATTVVSDRSIAYKIFVTANDRGLNLRVGDMIKGQLVDLVADAKGAAAGEQISKKWSSLQRLLRPHFDDFLSAVDFLEYREYRPLTYGEAVLDRFEGESPDEVVEWVSRELPEQANRFSALFHHERMDMMEGVHIPLRQLYFLQDRGWRPVAMALQWAYGGEQRSWCRSLQKLVAACYTLELLDWSPQQRARNYAKAVEQISKKQDPFRFHVAVGGEYGALHFSPNLKERARSALLSPITDQARRGALVHWLETLYWPQTLPKAPLRHTTVEHVLPRAAKGDWAKRFDESIREQATNLLGNLCLIREELNQDLGNAEFETKRDRFQQEPNIYKSVREIGRHQEWTPETLNERTKAIAAKATKALGLEPKI